MAKIVKICTAAIHLGVAREQLFRRIVVNHALHDADAHLKNYGLLYTSREDVRFAPAYDILTLPADPDFHQDIPGLTLFGTKTWACGKLLPRYAHEWLNIAPEKARSIVTEVGEAIRNAAADVKHYADNFPEFREIAKRMLRYWDRGLTGIQPAAKLSRSEADLRKTTGLSDETHRKQGKPNPYKNPDGSFSNKVR